MKKRNQTKQGAQKRNLEARLKHRKEPFNLKTSMNDNQ